MKGVYAMTDIDRITDVNSDTMKIIIDQKINCIFLDWFPSKEKIENEKEKYVNEQI